MGGTRGPLLERPWLLPALFVLLALPACLGLAPLIPPAEAPDENAHVLRAESLLYGDLTGTRTVVALPDGPQVEAFLHGDPGLSRVMALFRSQPEATRRMTAPLLRALNDIRWSGAPNRFSAQTATYPPPFYLPAALSLRIGRATRMTPFDALTAARMGNAVAYVVIGAAALFLAPRGRLLLFATLALPMSVWLASAVHPDAPTLACVALLIALTGCGRARWLASVLTGCVIAFKPPLLPLVVLFLLPGYRPEEHGSRPVGQAARRAGPIVLASLIGIGWIAFAQQQAASPVIRGAPYVAGPLYPGPANTVFHAMDPGAQLRVLAADPSRLLTVPLRSLAGEIGFKAREVVGVLGQLDLPLPASLYRIWCVALVAAVVGDMLAGPPGADGPRLRDILLVLAAAVVCLWGFYLVLYLTWTPVGAERVEGVQGRYFLPVLALLSLAIPRVRIARGPEVVSFCTAVVMAGTVLSMAALPGLTVWAFYGG